VLSISPDTSDNKKLGPVYMIKVSIQKDEIVVDGKKVLISPGMSSSVEVKKGKRRVIEFFLDPIIKYAEESIGDLIKSEWFTSILFLSCLFKGGNVMRSTPLCTSIFSFSFTPYQENFIILLTFSVDYIFREKLSQAYLKYKMAN